MDSLLGGYESSDADDHMDVRNEDSEVGGACAEANEMSTLVEDEDAFVGPARPPCAVLDDGEEATTTREEDARWLLTLRNEAEKDEANAAEKRSVLSAPEIIYESLDALPSEPETVDDAHAADVQKRVVDIFLEAKRRNVSPSTLMFTSRAFRNPNFMDTCLKDEMLEQCAFATEAMGFEFDDAKIEESDYYTELAAEQKRVTEQHLAERNGISFQSVGTGHATVVPKANETAAAQQAAVASAIAKARVEARIALENASKLSK